ncbi:MAG: hypothetical protein HY783_05185 [Chloroflexi bacterium]|nr:hypothetical protein [Chloroflexota bacterium]
MGDGIGGLVGVAVAIAVGVGDGMAQGDRAGVIEGGTTEGLGHTKVMAARKPTTRQAARSMAKATATIIRGVLAFFLRAKVDLLKSESPGRL